MSAILSINARINAVSAIWDERLRQFKLWGDQSGKHQDGTALLGDNLIRDSAQLECDKATQLGTVTWRHILAEEVLEAFAESDPDKLRTELVQAGAVIVSWLEDLGQRRAKTS
jgi:hypothetical protein